MQKKSCGIILMAGFAMFSMFFGSGNLVFPLAVGMMGKEDFLVAGLGLLLSGICVPFLGLLGMILFKGDYQAFLGRMGKWPGWFLASCIVALIGPFGVIPRCITVSYGTIEHLFPSCSLTLFSVIACLLIFLLTVRRNIILDILGRVLTPILLLSLGITVVCGFYLAPSFSVEAQKASSAFIGGVLEGYNTMDLLATFFFSATVISLLKEKGDECGVSPLRLALKASIVGIGLLAVTYFSLVYLSAAFSSQLASVRVEKALAHLSQIVLGSYGSFIFAIVAASACLTTAIALSLVAADFFREQLLRRKCSQTMSLAIVLGISFFISTLDFQGIKQFLGPIVEVCYPALIVLTILNIVYKWKGVKIVKLPVWTAFLISLYCFVKNAF